MLIKNNEIIFTSNLAGMNKPFIKSLLQRFPEFKKSNVIVPKIFETDNQLTQEAEAKILSLEKINQQSHIEIEEIRKNLEEKDRLINDILEKM